MKSGNKILLNLLSGLSHKQIFFFVWFAIGAGFVALMLAYYRKQTRSNFRSPGEGAGPHIRVDARRLPGTNQNNQVVVKEERNVAPTRKP